MTSSASPRPRRFPERAVLWAVAASAIVAACAGGGHGGCAWACGAGASAGGDKASATDVELLTPGSDPRIELRVARWTGLRYRSRMVASGALGVVDAAPIMGPTITLVVDNEVLRGSAEPIIETRHGGTVRLVEERATIERVTASQQGVAQPVVDFWNAALAPFRKTTYLAHVAESAEVTALTSELVGGAVPDDAVRKAADQALEQQRHVPFRLPPSRVGIGARWRFHEDVVLNGAHGTQSAEMTLRSIDPNDVILDVQFRQEAPRQEIANPLAPGTKAILERFQGDGTGELVVDRITAIVRSGALSMAARSTVTATTNGQTKTATLVSLSSMQLGGVLLRDDSDGAVP